MAKKPKADELMEKIDRLGSIREQIKELQVEEKKLTKEFKDSLDRDIVCYGFEYELKKTVRVTAVFDVNKIYNKLGLNKFLTVVNIVKTELAKHLNIQEIDAVTKEFTETEAIVVDRIKEK